MPLVDWAYEPFAPRSTDRHPAPDLDAAKAWWTVFLGAEPYFDQPFYVGYDVADYELGLLPDGAPEGGALAYWGCR
jgi:hypothetical protein